MFSKNKFAFQNKMLASNKMTTNESDDEDSNDSYEESIRR